jgi:hypothetical protein
VLLSSTANSSPPSRANRDVAPRDRGQPAGDLAQHLVTDVVTHGVVDLLEVVEVDQQHRERVIGVGLGDGPLSALAQQLTVRQAGQGVVQCLVLAAQRHLRVAVHAEDRQHQQGQHDDGELADVCGDGRQAEQDARGGQLEAHVLAENAQDWVPPSRATHVATRTLLTAKYTALASSAAGMSPGWTRRVQREELVPGGHAVRDAGSGQRQQVLPMLNSRTRRGHPLIWSESATADGLTRRAAERPGRTPVRSRTSTAR